MVYIYNDQVCVYFEMAEGEEFKSYVSLEWRFYVIVAGYSFSILFLFFYFLGGIVHLLAALR